MADSLFPNMDNSIKEIRDSAFHQGYVEGLRAYAWWKDGVQYVGTCGTTLKKAIEDAEKEYNETKHD